MACEGTISNICIKSTDSKCVDYDGPLSDNTTIVDPCVNQYEVNEDIYSLIDTMTEGLDTSLLGGGGGCGIATTSDTVGGVLQDFEDEICSLRSRILTLEVKDYGALDVTGFGIDFTCLANVCETLPTTLAEWMQAIQDKVCV